MRFKLKKELEKMIRNSIQKWKNNYYKFKEVFSISLLP